MPWKVVKHKRYWAVHKLNEDGSLGPVIKGGTHNSREDAEAHKRALYANVKH